MKISPMSVEEIKEQLKLDPQHYPYRLPMRRMILAWPHERARGNQAEHPDKCDQCFHAYHEKDKCKRYLWDEAEFWLNEVLDEINWPKEQR